MANRMDAWRWRDERFEERTMNREAWKLAHLLSPYSEKALTPQMFLDTPVPENEKMDELIRRIEKRAEK